MRGLALETIEKLVWKQTSIIDLKSFPYNCFIIYFTLKKTIAVYNLVIFFWQNNNYFTL